MDAQIKKDIKEREYIENKSRFDHFNERLKTVSEQADRCKTLAIELKKKAERQGQLTAEITAQFADLPSSLDELDEMLEGERARANLNIDTDPRVVEEFQSRKRDLATKRATFDAKQAELVAVRADIEGTQKAWVPAIEKLTEGISTKFSLNFQKLENYL